jgi:hypothetical protein
VKTITVDFQNKNISSDGKMQGVTITQDTQRVTLTEEQAKSLAKAIRAKWPSA